MIPSYLKHAPTECYIMVHIYSGSLQYELDFNVFVSLNCFMKVTCALLVYKKQQQKLKKWSKKHDVLNYIFDQIKVSNRCKSAIAIFVRRVTLNYTYSPFKLAWDTQVCPTAVSVLKHRIIVSHYFSIILLNTHKHFFLFYIVNIEVTYQQGNYFSNTVFFLFTPICISSPLLANFTKLKLRFFLAL